MRLIILILFLIPPASYASQVFSSLKAREPKNTTLLSSAKKSDEKIIETVITSGYGTSIESAAQNAAENALTKVVGSFIDAETQIKKQKEIRDGVISKIKVIKKDVRDYSQGSIKYFEILNVQQNGSIYNVTAKVDVRVEDFRAYIKKLAYGSTTLKKSLFTKIAVEAENKDSKRDIILKKILSPIAQGEVVEIKIGEPESLEDHYSSEYCQINTEYRICKETGFFKRFNKSKTIVMPVTFSLKKNFLENMKNTLVNISDDKVEYFDKNNFYNYLDNPTLPNEWEKNSNRFVLSLFDKSKNKTTTYLFRDVINPEWKTTHPMRDLDYILTRGLGNEFFNRIRIKVLDNQENILMSKDFGLNEAYEKWGDTFPFTFNPFFGSWSYPMFSLYSITDSINQHKIVFTKKEFLLAIEIDLELLKKTDSISIEYF